jgi:hypothetical protein
VKILPTINRHAWLALWAQKRRRARHALPAPMLDTLLEGLHEFYRPPATNQVFVNSHGETEAFDANPFVGLLTPEPIAGTGYQNEGVWYRMIAFREENSVRKYASLIISLYGGYVSGSGSMEWPAWGEWSEWPTGFVVVKAGTDLCLEISKSTMAAGWVDDNTGWTACPCSYAAPANAPKTLWRRSVEGASADGIIQTVASPLGGNAFDLTGGGHLVRQLADDALSRSNDISIAFWVCPNFSHSCSMWLGGSWTWHFFSEQGVGGAPSTLPDVDFNGVAGLSDLMGNCQSGDWYLVVQRGNTVADTLTQDVWRLRDGHHQRVVATLSACSTNPLGGPSENYVENEMHRILAFGSGYWWGNAGASYVDRMGTWTRTLTDEEVSRLWNFGFGWEPN